MSRSAGIIVACIVGFALLFSAMFFLSYERVEIEEREPPEGEARENPFLAFERLATEYGHATLAQRIMKSPWDCPLDHYSTACTIVLMPEDAEVANEDIAQFQGFVTAGGRLIVNVGSEAKRTLLVSKFETMADPTEPTSEVSFTTDFSIFSSESGLAKWVKATDIVARDQHQRVIAIVRPHGMGYIVFVARARQVFSNNDIGKAQHASLAMFLLGEDAYQHVTVVRYAMRASWMGYVFSKTWAALLPLLMAALARRRRTEHVAVVGRLLWKHDEVATLAAAVRNALIDSLTRRRAIPADDEPDAAMLADALDIDRDTARGILHDPSPRRPSEFLTWIRKMEQYRRQ
jgi:hypothetical protein